MVKNLEELKDFLDEKVFLYNQASFLEDDPLSIPHQYGDADDIAISAILTAIISWGLRKTIIRNANSIMQLMDDSPSDFVRNHRSSDLRKLKSFVHRTFNGEDLIYMIGALKNVTQRYGSLENLFAVQMNAESGMKHRINNFRRLLFEYKDPGRTSKHISDPLNNSAAKRICMFLRWMVRIDNAGCDFGIWSSISPAELMCPLDVHSGRVARKLHLLERKQNDWKAVEELSLNLRKLDPADPVKYDYALFGLGVSEKF